MNKDDFEKDISAAEVTTVSWVKAHQKASWTILAVIVVLAIGYYLGKH